MVTTRNLERLRPLNFGIRALREPVDSDVLSREIEQYDAGDAARVAEQVRATAGRESVVDELLLLYQEAILEFKGAEQDLAGEERAAADYLRWLSQRLKDNQRLEQEVHATSVRLKDAEIELDRAKSALERTTGTLGWRLLNRYGPIKYRFVLPAYRRIQRLLSGGKP